MEQGCGGTWRSGKSPATLRTKEMVVVTKLIRMMIIHLYKYKHLLFIYLFIYLSIYLFIYLFIYVFNYLFTYLFIYLFIHVFI